MGGWGVVPWPEDPTLVMGVAIDTVGASVGDPTQGAFGPPGPYRHGEGRVRICTPENCPRTALMSSPAPEPFPIMDLDCSRIVSYWDTTSTWYGAVYRERGNQPGWYLFRIEDRGLAGRDSLGMTYEAGLRDVNDGACGAANVAVEPLIAGDYVVTSR